MSPPLPLPTLLSQLLVAFTIEFDNESEHLMAHRTTRSSGSVRSRGPWLVSQVMWSNVMQYVGEQGVRVGDLHARSRTTRDSLTGLQRWGYVVVGPDAVDLRASPPRDDLVVRPTPAGRRAQEVWRPLAGVIEERWRERFGSADIGSLGQSLEGVVSRLDVELPQYLPVVYPTQNGRAEVPERRTEPVAPGASPVDLSTLLSRTLLAFTIDFERQATISLPISANTLRVLDTAGVRIRDLPSLTGVSKEANAMAVGFLKRHGCAVVEPDPSAGRGKAVRLTAKGQKAQDKYRRVLAATEREWETRFGRVETAGLRRALERVVDQRDAAQRSVLWQGLEPYPDGWRASVRRPDTLPHYPMVLHRGGYPDGS